MAPIKCCVGGCPATDDTHYLFRMPKNDNLRSLWMAFLVPTNPLLAGLTQEQLLIKRVCHEHFDKDQLYGYCRTRYSYPCFFSDKEMTFGKSLPEESHPVLAEQKENENNVTDEPVSGSDDSCSQNQTVPEESIEETIIEISDDSCSETETVPEDSIEETTVEVIPGTSKPLAEEPVTKQKPVAEEPVTTQKPVVEEPVTTQKPVAEEPVATQKPVAEEPVTTQYRKIAIIPKKRKYEII